VSFFDEGDEPTRVSTRARPARPRRPATAPRGGGRPPDRQTALVRQGVALGAGALILILVILGVKGCVDSQRQNSLKDYNRNVAAVVSDSDQSVAQPFFRLLGGARPQGNGLQVSINQLRLTAEEDARRAKAFDVPGAMAGAQRDLLLVLDLRSGALQRIADEVPSALGRGETSRTAINRIAAQMQAILASDVVYSQRVAPLIQQGLDSNGVNGQEIRTSRWLTDFGWLSPARVASALGGSAATGGGGSGSTACPTGSVCGHSLDSVSAGTTTLPPGGGPVRLTFATGFAFTVKFTNGGTIDETNVRVRITVKAPGSKTIAVNHTVAQSKAGTPTTLTIPLSATPPIGTPATVTTTVSPVPGEKNTANNSQSTTVIFGR
jgi:hypothetical protein